MFESYTIKDIAKALGLSTSTVSRALNDSYEIGEKTKKLVLDYAQKVNFKPNPVALSLKEQKSYSIGVVVCELANNFFSQAINGIESIAYNRGYYVIVTQTYESAEREYLNVKHLVSRHVDGLLVSLSAETVDTSYYKHLHDKGFPIVFFDRVAADIDTGKVITNNFNGAFNATEHLINNGYRKIAHLTSSFNLLISQERLDGYKAALDKHQIPFRADWVKPCQHAGVVMEEVEQVIADLLKGDDRPDAIFVASDRLTISCIQTLRKFNISIPYEIAVAGFNNSEVTGLFEPGLTVVRQPAYQIGQIAMEMLIQRIESKRPPEEPITREIEPELIIRASTAR
ncbi:MAG: LacI family transcriptional regulator [Sphingobacteriaceae bacterium]|nr:MAG: LacI family transcriptional regulator [Sphingobacteriaceae bacterium]